ncbi:hypothetical protein GGR50DRAFT_646751 [Xylaria sp. CBS 124048]|nr:hypothetical protein GGR50DRAFT_646751 [Xylaria sp. CBS 124048]
MDSSSIGSEHSSGKLATVKRIPQILSAKRRRKKSTPDDSSSALASTKNEEHSRGEHRPDTPSESGPLSTTTSSSNLTEDADGVKGVDAQKDDAVQNAEHKSQLTTLATPSSQTSHPTSSPVVRTERIPVQTLDQQETTESISRSTTSRLPHEPTYTLETSKAGRFSFSDSPLPRSRSPAGRVKSVLADSNRGIESINPSQRDGRQRQDALVNSNSQPGLGVSHSNPHESSLEARASRTNRRPSLHISVRPQTPPSSGSTAPVIVNTPPTPVDSSLPKYSLSAVADSNAVVSPRNIMISPKRTGLASQMSISPSKLATVVSAPLTPTPEDSVPAAPATGFFSSVFSAAQNAANTLSSTITNTSINAPGHRPKSNSSKETQLVNDERVEVESPLGEPNNSNMGGKEPAVKTLGMGDLSLSQLGFQETASTALTPATPRYNGSTSESRVRSESAPVEPDDAPTNGDGPSEDLTADQPRSMSDYANTTPPTSIYEDGTGVARSSSIRSAISKTKRRKRGSTGGTTGTANTIGAAIAAANASVAHPTAAGSAPKLTGFAVASKKRNRDFHALFKSVPDDDYLIEDYSCALQREILAHGRLYVSEGHLCFSSNILGWVTTLVMSFDEIVSVEKRSTALVFKNGLMISTLHAKHVFASFTSRDSTYDLIVNIWKLGHPTLRSSLNGVSIDETGGDKTEKVDVGEGAPGSPSASGSEADDSDNEIYDEDLEDDDLPEETQPAESGLTENDGEKALSKKGSGAAAINVAADKSDAAPSASGGDFPGPATHGPTECGDLDGHYEVPVGDDVVAAPLGKVYNHMFGPASVTWMSKWLTNEQKCTELQMEDKIGLTPDNKSRVYSYIKPLYASLGPKQTKCIVTETIEHIDFEKAVNILVTTQTPDVPNGNLFSVKTKYCLFWAENNSTRVTINCTIEWTGKSWLKGAIEKGAKDGQAQYWKDLLASLKTAVSSRARSTTLNGPVKGKKKKVKGKLNEASKDALRGPADSKSSQVSDWGLFEPLHSVMGPIFDILRPVITGNMVYGLLVGLLVATWFGFGFNSQPRSVGYGDIAYSGYPARAIAYDELWNREEGDLWDWLEERVGLYRMNEGAIPLRKRVTEPRTLEAKLQAERMNEREVKEAIRITEEKLDILKSIVGRKTDVPEGKSEGNGK